MSLGGLNIEYLEQYDSNEFQIKNKGTWISATVTRKTKDGTGKTPDKRRNEISFRNGFAYNYHFKVQITGSQKNSIVNIWQIKKLGDNFPRISIGIKRSDNGNQLAYKVRDNPSITIDDANEHNVFVDCKNGKLFIDNKLVTEFKPYIGESCICKFGIEADVLNVDQPIKVVYSNIKLTKIE